MLQRSAEAFASFLEDLSEGAIVTMERPAPIRSSWVTLRELESTHRRATCEGAGHEQRTIYRSRCPRGNDCGRGGGTSG